MAGRCDRSFGVTGTSRSGIGGHFESQDGPGLSARSSQGSATLTTGASGPEVRNAQGLLLAHGHDPGGIDGDFGAQTRAATVAFQTEAGIAPDGEIGPITWAAFLNHY